MLVFMINNYRVKHLKLNSLELKKLVKIFMDNDKKEERVVSTIKNEKKRLKFSPIRFSKD